MAGKVTLTEIANILGVRKAFLKQYYTQKLLWEGYIFYFLKMLNFSITKGNINREKNDKLLKYSLNLYRKLLS